MPGFRVKASWNDKIYMRQKVISDATENSFLHNRVILRTHPIDFAFSHQEWIALF